ncbi:MAG: hypothetical protein HY657_09915 [Acidobacteria bacterium]|nr:hypothetical protein [Acidobacteriota bacterium]
MRSAALALVLLFGVTAPGFADDGTVDEPIGTLRTAIASAFDAAPLAAGTQGADRADWQRRMNDAQSRRSRGIRYVFVGLGMGAAGSVIAAAGAPDYSLDSDGGSGLVTVGALTAIGGAGVFWYGIYNWLKGGNEVDTLDREGRANGFLTLAPIDGGAKVATALRF